MTTPNNAPFNQVLIETEMTVSGTARNKYATLGITIRDYFAAHAPEVPEWFEVRLDDGHEASQADRLFYWRWHYADTMMSGRA